MSSKFKLLVSLSIFALLLFTISAPTQIAKASPERVVTPSTFITLPAASFIPEEGAIYALSHYYIRPYEANTEFYAPIVLPDGATLRKIVISYLDYTNGGTVQAELWRVKLSDKSLDSLGSIESDLAGSSLSVQQMTMQVNKSISRYYAYTLHITMDTLCELYGIRVEYTMP